MQNIVVAGYGIAASTAAATLREQGYRGRISIVGAEHHAPYSRPALSKAALADSADSDSHLLPDSALDAQVMLGVGVAGLDMARRQLALTDGNTLAFDGLVIATGIRPRKLRPDLDLEFTFRTVEDAMQLRSQLPQRPRVAIVGGGVLGMELASACAASGCQVRVVCRSQPMLSGLGPYLADVVTRAAQQHGVSIVHPQAVDIREAAQGVAVRELVLADGTTIQADLVISALGDVPNTEWLQGSGLLTDGELRVDSRCRVVANVVAAGDVAVLPRGQGYARIPLWTSAIEQGKVAAHALLHGDAAPPLDYHPYFWTDLFGLAIKACGPLPVSGGPAMLEGEPGASPALMRWQHPDGTGTAVSINYRMPVPKLRALSRQAPPHGKQAP